MPKKPIDYTKPIIFYKFVKKNDTTFINCYVGHTSNWINRKYSHKSNCNTENNKGYHYKVYQIMRENGGWNNFVMIEIKREICIDSIDARKKEQELIEELNAKMNTCRSYISEEEKKKNHKDYNLKNKEEINEYQKEYNLKNKEYIKKNQKENYEKNKEKILEKQKDYYLKNKERIKEKNKEKINCICGSIFLKCNKSKHERLLKHKEYLSSLSNI